MENREIHFANITVTSEYFVFNECFTADVKNVQSDGVCA